MDDYCFDCDIACKQTDEEHKEHKRLTNSPEAKRFILGEEFSVEKLFETMEAIHEEEHPPDLGVHVTDGVKAEIKRGDAGGG